jgi:hypothetical protein
MNSVWGNEKRRLVEALCYKPEGRRFDSRYHRIFLIDLIFEPHYGPGIGSASKRNEYQESSGVVEWLARKTDNLTAIFEPID